MSGFESSFFTFFALSFTFILIHLFHMCNFVGDLCGFGYWVCVMAVTSAVVCELPAFGAVFPGEWLTWAFVWWMGVDVGVRGGGGGCSLFFWDGGVLSSSLVEEVCSFRFPSPEFDPIGWKSGHNNGSIIGSVLLFLSMP